jgi:hypothetical protein
VYLGDSASAIVAGREGKPTQDHGSAKSRCRPTWHRRTKVRRQPAWLVAIEEWAALALLGQKTAWRVRPQTHPREATHQVFSTNEGRSRSLRSKRLRVRLLPHQCCDGCAWVPVALSSCFLRAGTVVPVRPNVRANRTAAAGRLGPGWENVPRTPSRAKTARRWGSGGSARG